MLCNVNAQCDVNIAMHGNGNKNVITEKKKKKKKNRCVQRGSQLNIQNQTLSQHAGMHS